MRRPLILTSCWRRLSGLRFPLTRLIGKWKVSQNRPAADREGVIEGLLQEGADPAVAMAGLVRQYAPGNG